MIFRLPALLALIGRGRARLAPVFVPAAASPSRSPPCWSPRRRQLRVDPVPLGGAGRRARAPRAARGRPRPGGRVPAPRRCRRRVVLGAAVRRFLAWLPVCWGDVLLVVDRAAAGAGRRGRQSTRCSLGGRRARCCCGASRSCSSGSWARHEAARTPTVADRRPRPHRRLAREGAHARRLPRDRRRHARAGAAPRARARAIAAAAPSVAAAARGRRAGAGRAARRQPAPAARGGRACRAPGSWSRTSAA